VVILSNMTRNKWILLALLASAVLALGAWLLQGPAASPKKPWVVSVVQLTRVDAITLQGFKDGMGELGYREGQDIVYLDDGPAETIDRLEPMIRRHLSRLPDLFFVSSTPATQAVKKATASTAVPVVFAPVNDPVASGIVPSLQKPGGPITGIRLPAGDDLRLGWLARIAPGVKRVYLPYNPGDPSARTSVALAQEAASKLGLKLILGEVRNGADIQAALAALPAGVDAIFLPRDSTVESHIAHFVILALERRLPLCAPSMQQTEAGALFSYGFVHRQIGRQAARLADQILRGIPPADLPVETAESYLAINQRTARVIGLPLPGEILMQADEVIR